MYLIVLLKSFFSSGMRYYFFKDIKRTYSLQKD